MVLENSKLIKNSNFKTQPLRGWAIPGLARGRGLFFNIQDKQIMKTLVLTAGLVGVGKSTIAKAIAMATGSNFIDVDDFKKVCVEGRITNQIDPPEMRWAYYLKALEHAVDIFASGQNLIVMDEVFHLVALRKKLEKFCAERQIRVLWVEVKSTYETAKRRLNKKSRDGHILSTSEALRMHSLFAKVFEPFVGTDHICLNNDNDYSLPSLESVLKRICP